MKILNKQSTAILNKLFDLAKANKGNIKLDNSKGDFMPLVVEILEEVENRAKVSLAHYYEQNGDLMADPEMCFLIKKDKLGCMVVPYYYKQDNLGIERESVRFENGECKGYYPKMQADQTQFANIWMKNIKCQQKI